MDAVLFLNARTDDIIAVAQAAIIIDKIFWNQKQGDALGAGRVAFDARQNRVDNILSQIMFPIGYKDFTACQRVGPIVISDGSRRQRTDIRTRLGFGQQHGTAPFRGSKFFYIFLFLLRGAE